VVAGVPIAPGGHVLRASCVGRLALMRLARGEHDDLAAAEPTYLRRSDTEPGKTPPW
jgi:hypothetical protein